MQITLIQSEIEEALTAYIHSQITVKEGQKITIELKATRGAEGTTAVIDIVADKAAKAEPVKPTQAVSKPAETRQVTAKASEVVKDKPEVKTPEPEVETPDVDPSPDEQQEPDTGEGEDAASEANAAEESVEVAQEVVAKPKSLFEGLRKPKNE